MHHLAVEAYISCPGDIDMFLTPATYGGYLLDFAVDLYDLPADYDLYVYDSRGTEIAHSTNRGLTREHIWHYSDPRTGNSYHLKVVGVNGAFDRNRPYRLRFTMNPGTPAPPLYTPTAPRVTVPVTPAHTPSAEVKEIPHILFSSNRDGQWDLYVRNPDGSEVQLLRTIEEAGTFPSEALGSI